MHHQPILISTEVEDDAIIANEIHTPTELAFDVGRFLPLRLAGYGEPDADRSLGLRVTLPEFPQSLARDHLHGRSLNIMSPIWGQACAGGIAPALPAAIAASGRSGLMHVDGDFRRTANLREVQ